MIVTCTGTRDGANSEALEVFQAYLQDCSDPIEEAHHGDCLGADTQFHQIMTQLGVPVHIHPCNIKSQRSHCQGYKVYPVTPPLVRNRNMVDLCDYLVAFPSTDTEIVRSGTWATVRYARRQGRSGTIFWPDGTSSEL
jgi:hypothetical protein